MIVATIIYVGVLAILLVPAGVFAIQLVAALPPYRRQCVPPIARPTIAVLVPAHNEAFGLAATLQSIKEQLHAGDRLLVVADNCDDDTALVARHHGAEVIERHNTQFRGKGYALDAGVRHLALAPSEVVVIIDADCLLRPYTLGSLARTCLASQRPVQALYLMLARPGASAPTVVAAFAWLIKNWLRPLGWSRLGLPCQLMGTGMALPWSLVERCQLANGNLVEDMQLGLDCAALGSPPLFCPEAIVVSNFPDNREGSQAQRTRWEHGHLGMVLAQAPRLLAKGILHGEGALCMLALDACVPPLSLLLMLTTLCAALALVLMAWTRMLMPWSMGALPLALVGLAIGLAWLRAGSERLPFASLLSAGAYVLAKIPLYISFMTKRQVAWVASRRDEP